MADFDQEKLENAIRAQLIIAQQEEIINECIGDISADFGVNKPTAKKIIKAFAADKLEKTQEKMEDERSSLANAEVMMEAVENLSIEAPDMEDEEV
jgi:DNA-binding MarR family transcriptional regulator